MIEKHFKDIVKIVEITGHFNKNFKVITKSGTFHFKKFKDGTFEIKEWIEGSTVSKWDTKTLKLLHKEIKKLSGNAKIMKFDDIEDKNFKKILSKYKDDKLVFCHNDINRDNVIVSNDKLTIIDFEFCRMNHPYWEYANIIVEDKVDINLLISAIPSLKYNILKDWVYINKTFADVWKSKYQKK